ncbi:hypothetical protein [Serratia fonticola]|uniref:hypothetical protein n=1 Tax=Serratia fonticola TaxID=47917 RepID=UPI00301D64C0
MDNRFDFELAGKDDISDTLKHLEEVVQKMLPALDQANDKLKLGGQGTTDGLEAIGGKLSQLSTFAKSGVQYFGDMVPPLKMVGGLADRYGGVLLRMGGAGAVAYGAVQGIKALAGGLATASQEAYNLDVQAKNAGVSVHDLTRVAGAMEILGADTDTARSSVENLSKAFNDAKNNRNAAVLGAMQLVHASIFSRSDGTADTMKTLENLAEIYPKLSAQNQKTVADALGLNEATLALLRDGAHYKELLSKSDQLGLTVSGDTTQKLTDVNSQLNELSASWEGLKRKTENNLFSGLLSDGSVSDGLAGANDLLQHGPDNIALMHVLGVSRGNEANELREIKQNKELYNTLSTTDKVSLDFGVMTDSIRMKYENWHKPVNTANQLMSDVNSIRKQESSYPTNIPPLNNNLYEKNKKDSFGLRNNNPGNLREAPNTSGNSYTKNGVFAKFKTPEEGLAALSRQLMLYADRNKNTLNDILPIFAPKKENNTQAYIDDVSKKTGLSPTAPLDLHSPDVLERLMPAIINHENGVQPFTLPQIKQAIHDSIFDPQWSGKRDSQQLLMQRQTYAPTSSQQGNVFEQPQGIVDQSNNQALVAALSQAMLQAQREGKSQIELVITNGSTGEKHVVTLPPGGKVTTSMSSP